MHRDIADKAFTLPSYMKVLEGGVPLGTICSFGAFRERGKSYLSNYGGWLVSVEPDSELFYYPERDLTFMRCYKWLNSKEITAPRTNAIPRSSHLTYCIKQAYQPSQL